MIRKAIIVVLTLASVVAAAMWAAGDAKYLRDDVFLDRNDVSPLPLWMILLFLTPYPTLAFIRGPLRRWRRKRKGLCLACGYDLTGNVTGTCSECGAKLLAVDSDV